MGLTFVQFYYIYFKFLNEAEGFIFLLIVSMSKGYTMKYGKKQFVPDENRRNTYWQSQQSASGREPSVLTTFDAERKLLMAVCVVLFSIIF